MSTAYPWRVLAASLAGVLVLAGCGTGGEQSGGAAASTGGHGDAAAGDTADGQRAADHGGKADPVEVAPADLANFACSRGDNGRWTAEGIVTNSAGRPMVYTVTVVTVDDSEQVVGERLESFELKPDETKPFHWPRFYRGAATACMPHVEREPA